MEDIVSVAAVPVEAMRPQGRAAEGVQLVEGYAGIAQGGLEPAYPDHRGGGGVVAGAGLRAQRGELAHAPPPAARPAVFAFTASTSDEEGDFELAVDGRPR